MRLGLVAPDWRVWFIASDSEDARRASLRQLVDALGIDWKLAGNLRQLVGLDDVWLCAVQVLPDGPGATGRGSPCADLWDGGLALARIVPPAIGPLFTEVF